MAGQLMLSFLISCFMAVMLVQAEDPYIYFTWKVAYGTASPLGVPQKVIMINDQFPGPNLNSTTNNNIVLDVTNGLDEPLLISWNGVQHRKNTWHDGMPGTTCPILPGTNFTYHFQVKDQIGSYFYFPSIGMQKASGGYGGLRINSRNLIPVPFDVPEDDYTVLMGDWYSEGHVELKKKLDNGETLGKPNGVIINGKAGKTNGKDDEPLFTFKAGKTYRFRICNVGIKAALNFRVQGHTMKLVEIDGSHTVQNLYQSLDVHVGQCYSVLVTADQTPRDYYVVASTRFTKYMLSATAVIRYVDASGAKAGGPPSPALPEAPVGWAWSLNQYRSYRWNLTASAARPNPQGSYHYGAINITRTIRLANTAGTVDGKLRYAINGVSHVDKETPVKLAQYYGVADKVFKYNIIGDEPPANNAQITVAPNVLNATFRDFIEIILENHEKGIQSWHLDGYSFFPVAIEPGKWSPDRRKNYNLLDAVSRHSIEVYPKSWAAIMLTLDNAGMWNLRSNNWEQFYLGQQLYLSVISPELSLQDEYNMPDNFPLCGIIKDLPKPPPYEL